MRHRRDVNRVVIQNILDCRNDIETLRIRLTNTFNARHAGIPITESARFKLKP